MAYRIEVSGRGDAYAEQQNSVLEQLKDIGVSTTDRVEIVRLFFVEGDLPVETVNRLTTEVLADDVVEDYRILDLSEGLILPEQPFCEISPKPGVTDSVAESLLSSAALLGIAGIEYATTGHRYVFHGDSNGTDIERIASGLLANEVVQRWSVGEAMEPPFARGAEATRQVEWIDVRRLDDAGLEALSQERRLSLNLEEMQAIREHFVANDRDATDLELEMLAQTWSEHCVHKTFRALIEYSEVTADGTLVEGSERTVDSMLKTFLKEATDASGKPWIRSAFVDNAGIVAFDEELDLALKVETHNHPSALEPFGGANTGVGGCVRDILGVSARPIANTDVLCFGPQDMDASDLPDGVLHPRRISAGVISGIEDYGNKMGIPTVNGSIVYDAGYTANPLVFCGCVGILPTGSHKTDPQAGDRVVVLGGKTGRDGLRGATFSSMEMTHETGLTAGSAVQIGHPINEKQVQEVVIEARDAGLYTAITDCGAGGLSSSVGEMGEVLGADVQLETVPLKYPGLEPWEIWLSEAQERMVMAVPDENWDALCALCARHGVEVCSIGRFTGNGRLRIRYEELTVCDLETRFLHDGIPQRRMKAVWQVPEQGVEDWSSVDGNEVLLSILGSPNVASKEDVIRRYDHEVQGGTVCKPLVGVNGHGPGDAAVLVPLVARQAGRTDRGVAIGCGVNPAYGALDPYRMAVSAVDEAMRNIVSVGADPDQVSLTDNFCWGNPNLPDRLGALVRCGSGCHDAAVHFKAPYISGKDSLNNEYSDVDGSKHAIPGTILITAMGIVPNAAQTCTSDFKRVGNHIIIVGETRAEMGGSALAALKGSTAGEVPALSEEALTNARAVYRLISGGLASACHDCSDGGLAVAVAEMAIGAELGASIRLTDVPVDASLPETVAAFSESNSRYVLEVAPENLPAVADCLAAVAWADIGEVTSADIVVSDYTGGHHIHLSTTQAKNRFCG